MSKIELPHLGSEIRRLIYKELISENIRAKILESLKLYPVDELELADTYDNVVKSIAAK